MVSGGGKVSFFFKDVALAGQAHSSEWSHTMGSMNCLCGLENKKIQNWEWVLKLNLVRPVLIVLLQCLYAFFLICQQSVVFLGFFFLNEVYDTQVYFSIKFFIVFLFLNIN